MVNKTAFKFCPLVPKTYSLNDHNRNFYTTRVFTTIFRSNQHKLEPKNKFLQSKNVICDKIKKLVNATLTISRIQPCFYTILIIRIFSFDRLSKCIITIVLRTGKVERQKSSERTLSKTPSIETKKLDKLPDRMLSKTPSVETKKLDKFSDRKLSKALSVESKKIEKLPNKMLSKAPSIEGKKLEK